MFFQALNPFRTTLSGKGGSSSIGFNPSSLGDLAQRLMTAPTALELVDSARTGTARPQQPGRALEFNGVDTYISFTTGVAIGTSDYSAVVKVNFDNFSTTPWLMASSGGTNDTPFRIDSSGVVTLRINGNTITFSETLSTGSYYTLGMNLDRDGNADLYVDGVFVESQDISAHSASSIGNMNQVGGRGESNSFDGKIAQCIINTSLLSAAEMLAIHKNTFTGSVDLFLKLDEGAGTKAYDSSGNRNDGDLTNSPTRYEGSDVPYSWQNEVGYSPLLEYLQDSSLWSSYESGGVITLPGGSSKFTYYAGDLEDIGIANGEIVTLSYDVTSNDGVTLRTATGQGGLGTGSTTIPNTIGSHSVELEVADQTKSVQFWNGGSATDSDFIVLNNISLKRKETASGLILLPRDESDTANDIFGNALEYTGQVPRNARLINSPCGTFDGVNDFVAIPDFADLGSTFSFSTWVKTSASGAAQGILSQYLTSTNDRSFRWNLSSSGVPGIYLSSDGTANTLYSATTAVNNGQWRHLAVTFNAGALTFYLDGLEDDTAVASQTSVYNTSADVTIGSGFNSGSELFTGNIFDTRIYSDVSTADEVTHVYTSGRSGTDPTAANLIMQHTFSENAGPTVHDASGNNNRGTIINATTTPAGTGFWANTQDLFHSSLVNGFNKSYQYNGTSSYHNTGFQALPAAGSLEVWVTLPDISGSIQFVCGIQGVTGEVDNRLAIGFSGNLMRTYIGDISGNTGPTALSEGDTVLVKVEYDGSTCNTYIDGVLDDSFSYSGDPLTSFDFYIGARNLNGSPQLYTDAQVHRVRIANASDVAVYDTQVDGWGTAVNSPDAVEVPFSGVAVTSNPAGACHNGGVTQIDFTGGVAAPWVSKVYRGYALFAGAEYIELGGDFDWANAWDVEFEIYPATTSSDNIFTSTSNGSYSITCTTTDVRVRINGSLFSTAHNGQNVWTKVRVTYEGGVTGEINTYIDDVLQSTVDNDAGSVSHNAGITLGANNTLSQFYEGRMRNFSTSNNSVEYFTAALVSSTASSGSATPTNNGVTFPTYTVPTAYSFGDDLGTQTNHYKKVASTVLEAEYVIYNPGLTAANDTAIKAQGYSTT